MSLENTTLLVGTGRSGTSWLANLINHRNEYQYVFEPFNTRRCRSLARWRYRQYIPPENKDLDRLRLVESILSGRVREVGWTDKFNQNWSSNRILVKSIRAHHLMGWIKNHFPEIKLVLLLRYPGIVAESKMALGWEIHIDEFLSQEDLVRDYFKPFLPEIQKIKDPFEQHILFWCMENYIPLKQLPKEEDLHVIFYEDLCRIGEKVLEELFTYTGQEFCEEFRASVEKNLKRPSELCRKDSIIRKGKNPLIQYSDPKTIRNHEKVKRILEIFGLEVLYRDLRRFEYE